MIYFILLTYNTDYFIVVRRDLFYLLDFVTCRSEKSRLKKKIGLETNWCELSKYRHTFVPMKKCYFASLSNS